MKNPGVSMKIIKNPVEKWVGPVLLLALAGSIFSLVGCAHPSGEKQPMKAAPVAAAPDPSALVTRTQRLSYALGMVLGSQFRDQSIEVDPEHYIQGFQAGLSGGMTLLTETEASAAVNELRGELKRKQAFPPPTVTIPTGIEVSFKLDPRLTRSMYMGDRWVSPPTFTSTVQTGKVISVAARAQGVGAQGQSIKISPEWIPDDPGMVTVSPSQGEEVMISVEGAGQSKLKVVAQGISTELYIKATYQNETIQVEITR
jgi:hypothetical protein